MSESPAKSSLYTLARVAVDWVDLQLSHVVEGLARCAPHASGRLLDVGCGDKPYEHLFTPHVSEYIGVEYDESYSVTSAGARGKADVVYNGDRMPFEDASFDTVLNVQVLEHTSRPAELLRDMARVLKPGGLLIISVPFSFRLHEEPHDYFRYSPHGLRELCARAGLELVSVEPLGGLWSLLAHKMNSYLAIRVARMIGATQAIGKFAHEPTTESRMRTWTLPFVGPAVLLNAAGARVFDRLLPDPTETLGFTAMARRVGEPSDTLW